MTKLVDFVKVFNHPILGQVLVINECVNTAAEPEIVIRFKHKNKNIIVNTGIMFHNGHDAHERCDKAFAELGQLEVFQRVEAVHVNFGFGNVYED